MTFKKKLSHEDPFEVELSDVQKNEATVRGLMPFDSRNYWRGGRRMAAAAAGNRMIGSGLLLTKRDSAVSVTFR